MAGTGTRGMRTKATGTEDIGTEAIGTEATASTTGFEAHGSAWGSGSGHSGALIGVGGRTGLAMRTPQWSSPQRHGSIFSPHHPRPSIGTIAMPRKPTTRMSNNAQGAGGRSPRRPRHKRSGDHL